MRNALYVENLPGHLGRAELERLLRPYGSIRGVVLATDPDVLRRRAGLAVAAMATGVQARAAIRAVDGMEYRGGTLRARPALPADVPRLACMCRWEFRPGGAPVRTCRCASHPRPPGDGGRGEGRD